MFKRYIIAILLGITYLGAIQTAFYIESTMVRVVLVMVCVKLTLVANYIMRNKDG